MFPIILGFVFVAGVVGGPTERIVGGSTAPEGRYPYQISLRDLRSGHFCGGSIIASNWILTAAHCVYGKSASSMYVVAGANNLFSGGSKYAVYQVIWHQAYNPSNNVNDIALLRLNQNIAFGQKISAISLANSNPLSGTSCILSGWGLTSYPSQQLPSYLQQISLTAITLRQCVAALPGMPVTQGNLCTYKTYGQGACQGDSGGPLIANGEQVGVVSWGIPCAKGNPDIFSSVAYFRNWIRAKSGI
ncbi:hypothetical protein PPYR_02723 [Photinus pyralis]|uniref:Peptidase S1 domain-containing protein n=2 Tax=Photinus pyralis TaxID=7054 RepID=A0A5N4A0T2_PHOPY|nr:chymotrypsin-2-like [Photinus pyralis]KAB0790923.1 hypothetical protein PPYR_02723 [Photinus pyralis]